MRALVGWVLGASWERARGSPGFLTFAVLRLRLLVHQKCKWWQPSGELSWPKKKIRGEIGCTDDEGRDNNKEGESLELAAPERVSVCVCVLASFFIGANSLSLLFSSPVKEWKT